MAEKLARSIEKAFGAAYRASCGHRRVGLLYEDLFVEDKTVQEALRRLPEDLAQARLRRMKTSSQCYVTHSELPKEQWITEEQDVPYLSPYVEEIEREDRDRASFWV